MKRAPFLQQLSREHHQALVLALRIAKAADAGTVSALQASIPEFFRNHLAAHFAAEETDLLPTLSDAGLPGLVERTLDEHRQLHALVRRIEAGDAGAQADFASLLRTHVQFEERELFPALELALANDG